MEEKIVHVIKGTVVSKTGSVIHLNNEFESAIQLGEFIKLLKDNEYVFKDDIRAITRTEKSLELRDFMIKLDKEQMNAQADEILRDIAEMVEDDMTETTRFYHPDGRVFYQGQFVRVQCEPAGQMIGQLSKITSKYIVLSNEGFPATLNTKILRSEIKDIDIIGGRD